MFKTFAHISEILLDFVDILNLLLLQKTQLFLRSNVSCMRKTLKGLSSRKNTNH